VIAAAEIMQDTTGRGQLPPMIHAVRDAAESVPQVVTADVGYRDTLGWRDPSLEAMPRLADWADEASVVHWYQDHPARPDWTEAGRRCGQCVRLGQRGPASTEPSAAGKGTRPASKVQD
jgi:hypothetical protein